MRFLTATMPLLCAMLAAPMAVSVRGDVVSPRMSSIGLEAPRQSVLNRFTTHEVTLPVGTRLPVVLESTVASDSSRIEQPVRAHVSRDVLVNGQLMVPAGSEVYGVVTDARRAGKAKGLAHVAVRFDTLIPRGSSERYRIETAGVGRTAPATKKKDAITIGAPAAGGALVGALLGGKKGALIGTAVGGGAGTAVVVTTRGKEVRLGPGAPLTLRLTSPLTIRVQTQGRS